MNSKLMRNGWLEFLENEKIKLHKVDDTHMWLIVPKDYSPSVNWRDRMKELVQKLFGLKLMIAYKK